MHERAESHRNRDPSCVRLFPEPFPSLSAYLSPAIPQQGSSVCHAPLPGRGGGVMHFGLAQKGAGAWSTCGASRFGDSILREDSFLVDPRGLFGKKMSLTSGTGGLGARSAVAWAPRAASRGAASSPRLPEALEGRSVPPSTPSIKSDISRLLIDALNRTERSRERGGRPQRQPIKVAQQPGPSAKSRRVKPLHKT